MFFPSTFLIFFFFMFLSFFKSYLFTGVNSYKVHTSSFGTCTSRDRSCVKKVLFFSPLVLK